MDYTYIQQEIAFRYPLLVRSFGDISTFLSNAYTIYPQQIRKLTSLLLNDKTTRVQIVDPVEARFSICDIYDLVDQEAVVLQEPYSVYNLDGDLLYQVSNHNGIFGNSILDRTLLLESQPATLFVLEYFTYQGKAYIYVILGLLPASVTKDIGRSPSSSTTLLQQSTLNQLLLTFSSGQRDYTKPGLPYFPLKVYYLPTPSPVLLPRAAIMGSSLTAISTYDPNLSPLIMLNPTNSGWLIVNQVQATQESSVAINNLSGPGSDRIVNAGNGIYYVALSIDINLSLFKQSFNLTNVTLPSIADSTGVNITATLVG